MASEAETNAVESDAVASANRGKIAALAKSGFEASNLALLLAAAVGTGVLGYFAYPLVNWGASSAVPPPKPAVAANVNPDTLMAANTGAAGIVAANPNPANPQGARLNNGLPINAYGSQNPHPNSAGVQRGAAQPQGPSQAQILNDAARRAPVMAFSGGVGGYPSRLTPATQAASFAPQDGGATVAAPSFVQTPNTAASGAGGASNALDQQRQHGVIELARATLVSNRSFLLSAGTLVPCVLQTAINSTQLGYVSCIIPHDVWSEDGRVVLLEKGTKVLGQYTGGIQQGQHRLFILWTRALTPRGVAIDLSSPASDQLGRSGVDGGVDTQFFARFGSALLLSVIEDAGLALGQHFAGAGTNTTQVPSNVANTALQSSVNIAPIIRKNQGDEVGIFVAKDFDFKNVYRVTLRK